MKRKLKLMQKNKKDLLKRPIFDLLIKYKARQTDKCDVRSYTAIVSKFLDIT